MKYRLLAEHVLADGQLLEEGTEVGDDTPYPWRSPRGEPLPPSTQMEGLDDEGRKAVDELHQKLYGAEPYWTEQNEDVRKAREKEAEDQRKLDEDSEPVSAQQRAEREFAGREGDRDPATANVVLPRGATRGIPPGPGREPSSTATAAPTTGGSTRPSPGVATPAPPSGAARPANPNQEQYPKDNAPAKKE
jgi:hypothetical protein